MAKKPKMDDYGIIIKVKGMVSSQISKHNYFIDDECYHFRLTCSPLRGKIMDFTIKCYDKTFVEGIGHGDTVIVEGYYTDDIFQNNTKIEIKRNIYCRKLSKQN